MSSNLFTRPIEIRDLATHYRITYNSGGGATNVDINPGTYADITALLKALSTAATSTMGFNITWSLYDTGTYIACKVTAASSVTVAINTVLRVTLGDPTNAMAGEATSTTHTSTYQSTYLWASKFENATQDRWHVKYNELGAGSVCKTGEVNGNTTGPDIYYHRLRYTNELATKLYDEAATDAYQPTYNWMAFVKGAVWSSCAETGHASTRGVFYWPDLTDATGNPGDVPGGADGATTTYEGINYDLSSSPDRFTFCQFDMSDLPLSAAHPSGKVYYGIDEFELHTIDSMPTWQAPNQT